MEFTHIHTSDVCVLDHSQVTYGLHVVPEPQTNLARNNEKTMQSLPPIEYITRADVESSMRLERADSS